MIALIEYKHGCAFRIFHTVCTQKTLQLPWLSSCQSSYWLRGEHVSNSHSYWLTGEILSKSHSYWLMVLSNSHSYWLRGEHVSNSHSYWLRGEHVSNSQSYWLTMLSNSQSYWLTNQCLLTANLIGWRVSWFLNQQILLDEFRGFVVIFLFSWRRRRWFQNH